MTQKFELTFPEDAYFTSTPSRSKEDIRFSTLENGGGVLSWRSFIDGSTKSFMQVIGPDGRAVGSEFVFEMGSGNFFDVIVNGDTFVFSARPWIGGSISYFAQIYNASAEAIGSEISSDTSEISVHPVGDKFLVSVTSTELSGDHHNVMTTTRFHDKLGNVSAPVLETEWAPVVRQIGSTTAVLWNAVDDHGQVQYYFRLYDDEAMQIGTDVGPIYGRHPLIVERGDEFSVLWTTASENEGEDDDFPSFSTNLNVQNHDASGLPKGSPVLIENIRAWSYHIQALDEDHFMLQGSAVERGTTVRRPFAQIYKFSGEKVGDPIPVFEGISSGVAHGTILENGNLLLQVPNLRKSEIYDPSGNFVAAVESVAAFPGSERVIPLGGGGAVLLIAGAHAPASIQIIGPDGQQVDEPISTRFGNPYPGQEYVYGLDGGGALLTWRDGTTWHSQFIDEFGSRTGPEQQASELRIARLGGGGLVLKWRDVAAETWHAQIYDADGQAHGPDFFSEGFRAISMHKLSNGSVFLSWNDGDSQLKHQFIGSDGMAIGEPVISGAWGWNITVLNDELIGFNHNSSNPFKIVSAEAFFSVVTVPDDFPETEETEDTQDGFSAFLVNTTTRGAQMAPATAARDDGGFVAVWIDESEPGNVVRGQLFDANAARVGQEFRVSPSGDGTLYAPRVATLADGRFVVVWDDHLSERGVSFSDIRAQVFDANGTRQGDGFVVNTTTLRDQTQPDIAALQGGGFVVTWLDGSFTATPTGLAARAQVFGADAAPVGAELAANGDSPVGADGNAVLGLDHGGFLMLWQERGVNASLKGQTFTAEGVPHGTLFTVNQTTQGMQGEPAVAALSGGRFVVAWTDGSRTGGDTSGTAIRAQVFDSSGGRIGPEQLVNTQVTEGDQRAPAIGVLADGRFLIAWQSQGDAMAFAGEIRAQLFNANGTRSGTEFAINPMPGDTKSMPSVVGLEGGRFAVLWDDFSMTGGDTDSQAVRGQVLDADDVRGDKGSPDDSGSDTGGPGVTDPEPAPPPPTPPPTDLPDPASPQVLQAGDLLLITDQPWTPQGRGHISAEGAEVTVRHAESGALLMTLIGQTQVNPDTLNFEGTVIAAAPTIAEPVMQGSFTLDLGRLQTTALADAGAADTFAFGTNAVALEISAIRLQPFSALFAADLSLDPVLPGISTRNSPFFLRTDEIGYFLEPSGAGMRFLEDEPFKVSFAGGAGLEFSLSDVWFFYDNFERAMYLGGKGEAKWSGEVAGANFADLNPRRTHHKIELDLRGELEAEESILGTRGDKFIRIALQGDGLMDRLDWAGSLKYTAMPSLTRETGVLFVREAKLEWNTVEQTIGGSAKVELSFLKGVTAEAAVTLQYDPLALQKLSVGLDNLNLPIGATGFFVQGGLLELDNIASRNTSDDVLELTGTLKLSFGRSALGLRPPVEITVTGSYSSNEASLGMEVKKTAGALLPERVVGALLRTGESNHPMVKSLTTEFSVKPDELLDYEILKLTATISMNYAANHTTIEGTASVLNGALFGTATAVIWTGDNGGTSYQVTFNWGIEVPARVPILGGSRAGIVVGARGGDTAGYVEAYGYVDASFFGIGRGQQALGFRLHNDGRFEEINARNLPKINSWELAPSQDMVVMSARWEHAAPDAELVVITPDGTRLRESDLAAQDNIAILDDFSSATRRTLAVSRPEAGIWDIELVSAAATGEVIYEARELLQGAEGTIRRVVQNTATERLAVTYDLTLGDAEAATLGFQFADAQGAQIGVELLSMSAQESGQGLVAEIDLTALMPGEYWLLLRAEGLGSAPQIAAHDSPIVVTGAADLAVQSEYRWNEATATKSAVFTVSNEGTRLSGQATRELEVPETLIGGALNSDLMQQALGQLAPGESAEVVYDLGRAVIEPEAQLVARVTSTGHDADIRNNTDTLTPVRVTGEGIVQAWVSHVLPADLARLELQGGAALDGTGHAGDNVLSGNAGANRLEGGGGDNLFMGGGGDDTIIGGAGHDIAVYRGTRDDYDIQTDRGTGVTTVTDLRAMATTPDHDGTDTLTDVNVLRFADIEVTLGAATLITITDRSGMAMTGVTLGATTADGMTDDIGRTDDSGQILFVAPAESVISIIGALPYEPETASAITARDALEVLRLAVGLAPSWGPADPMDFIAADINQDGQVTAADALDVLRAAVGIQGDNPPRWFFLDSDADLAGISRSNSAVEEGILFDPRNGDLSDLNMTGVLLGNMQEYGP